MSRTPDYDVGQAWPAERAESADDAFRRLLDLGGHVFHGAHQPWTGLKSSLDVELEENEPARDGSGRAGATPEAPPAEARGYALETGLLTQFAEQCFRHLQPGARRHLELARLRWGTYRSTGTLFVGRHYGLPTRALDWTSDPAVALFFACRRRPDIDGVIWCMDQEEFEGRAPAQWHDAYSKTEHIESDFERDFIKGVEQDVLATFYFPEWMPRAVTQKAFVTIAGRFGTDHARKIHELGVRVCKRIVIRAELKQPIIEQLDLMGINGYTLEIGDSTVETVAADIVETLRPGRGAGEAPAAAGLLAPRPRPRKGQRRKSKQKPGQRVAAPENGGDPRY